MSENTCEHNILWYVDSCCVDCGKHVEIILEETRQKLTEKEKWQKEAVPFLKKLKRKCDFLMEEIHISALIELAEGK